MSDLASWRELIKKEMRGASRHFDDLPVRKPDPGPIIACTLSEEELDVRFECGFGGVEGKPFTAWTETRVYFPCEYDGSESVGSAPRNPCDEITRHQ